MKNLSLFKEIETNQTQEGELFKRVRDESLDFRGIPASQGVYAIHPYPAMFHFLLVRRFINELTFEGQWVFDPFCGSGVSAVESYRLNRNFVGYDVNPLAVLISKVRTTPLQTDTLFKVLNHILDSKVHDYTVPKFHNIDYWFDEDVIEELAKIKSKIYSLDDEKVKNFFKVVFSETLRKVSNADFNEFKLVRKKEVRVKPNVKKVFHETACKNILSLQEINTIQNTSKILLTEKNVLEEDLLEEESVHLVLTSPPYGDSRTTVAYEQFSKLSIKWLDLPEDYEKKQLGAKVRKDLKPLPSDELHKSIERIERLDRKRAQEVYSFYHDLYIAIEKIARTVRKGGYAVFVVGNRTVKGVTLPTDKIVADFFTRCGFKHLITLVREISNKRMPKENSPNNVRGQKSATMKYEYVLILQKR